MMTPLNQDNFSELISDADDQKKRLKKRRLTYYERSISKKEFSGDLEPGWRVLDDTLKTRVKLAKDKSRQEIFEDEVWGITARLGFKYLSSNRKCVVQYEDGNGGATQQLDILAVDDETAIIIECKCADSDVPVLANFKTQIEAIGGKKPGLQRAIQKLFGVKKLKFAYILATKNYIVKPKDQDRLDKFNIRHFSNADLEYYDDLVNHLGKAARYQFQADLFPGQDIPGIENRVYAIKGKMGPHTYYSFSIEPHKLLKLGYVLHRTKSIKLLPSYQRLIKKNRLTAVRNFIEDGGYFPNSIIINIDTGGKKERFDPSQAPIETSELKPGVLYLPPKYRSAYIIDGQHRLYAYSDADVNDNQSIPVVAFINLERTEQLSIFMQINENQKSVSKNLKHTLDADLKWDAEDNLKDRADGIKKQFAQDLGEDIGSPLYQRILVGEDQRTDIKIITLDAVLRGINNTKFIGRYTKDTTKEHGYFYTGDSEKTLQLLKDIIYPYFEYVAEKLPNEWNRPATEFGLLTINDGLTALISLLGDIIEHMVSRQEISPLKDPAAEIVDKAKSYIPGVIAFFENLDDDERKELRSRYGSGAPAYLRRILQRAINEERDDFEPEGLHEFWRDQSKIYNVETFKRVGEIETYLKEDCREKLIETYGNMWMKKGLPEKVYTSATTQAAKKNREIEDPADEKSPWDCLFLINYRDIMLHQNHWSTMFQKNYTIPSQAGKKKEEKTEWLVKLNTIRNKNDHEYSVSKEEHDYVDALHDWLILGETEKIEKIVAPG